MGGRVIASNDKRVILVTAAHPDDEALGCGGTIARYAAEGDEVHLLFFTDGVSSRTKESQGDMDTGRRAEAAMNSAKTLGAQELQILDFPDNALDSVPLLEIVRPIEDMVEAVNPDIVFTHHGSDLNIDHRLVHQAVITACRPLPNSSVRSILAFETLSSTEWSSPSMGDSFRPNYFIDISDFLEKKLEAFSCYSAEIRPFPHSRSKESIVSLARCRGASVGVPAAEAFMVIREVM